MTAASRRTLATPGGEFDAAVTEALPKLYRFALVLTREPSAAEDLVQDTVVRALERRESFRGEASLATWLHRIAHNLAVDRARRSVNELPVEDVEERWRDDAYSVDAAVVVARTQQRTELEDALVRLPETHRTPLVLHDVEGWTVPEITGVTGVSPAATAKRLARGRMMLVTALASGAARRRALEGVPMRCWDARQMVSDYLDDQLAQPERERVESHLQRCPTCPPLYAALVGTTAELGRLRDRDAVIPDAVRERLARSTAARE
jgi:RNA polymerase sigma-70 factor, ECF subfamily